ncbi:MAG: hypothetical protein ACK4UN_16055 [Limisphaerales bacterium]
MRFRSLRTYCWSLLLGSVLLTGCKPKQHHFFLQEMGRFSGNEAGNSITVTSTFPRAFTTNYLWLSVQAYESKDPSEAFVTFKRAKDLRLLIEIFSGEQQLLKEEVQLSTGTISPILGPHEYGALILKLDSLNKLRTNGYQESVFRINATVTQSVDVTNTFRLWLYSQVSF